MTFILSLSLEFVDDVMASSREHNTNSTGGPSVGEITIYANGFQIGTQEFRSLNEGPNQEQNKAFLAALQRREVPSELDKEIVAEYGPAVEEVGITIVNRSQETFTPPKEKFSFSKSQGQSLVSEKDEQAKNTVLQAFSDAKPLKYVQLPLYCETCVYLFYIYMYLHFLTTC